MCDSCSASCQPQHTTDTTIMDGEERATAAASCSTSTIKKRPALLRPTVTKSSGSNISKQHLVARRQYVSTVYHKKGSDYRIKLEYKRVTHTKPQTSKLEIFRGYVSFVLPKEAWTSRSSQDGTLDFRFSDWIRVPVALSNLITVDKLLDTLARRPGSLIVNVSEATTSPVGCRVTIDPPVMAGV